MESSTMTTMANEQQREHFVIFPLMSQGHAIPSLSLALHLETRGYQVSLITTPSFPLSLPPSSNIRLRLLPFVPSEHGLPPSASSTDGLSPHLIPLFVRSTLSLRPHFRTLLLALRPQPVCVVSDIFFTWTAEAAKEFGIHHVVFCITTGFGMACLYSTWMNLPHLNNNNLVTSSVLLPTREEAGRGAKTAASATSSTLLPSRDKMGRVESTQMTWQGNKTTVTSSFLLPDFEEAGRIDLTQLSQSLLAASESDAWTVFQRSRFPEWFKTDGIIFNTVEELDGVGLEYFRKKIGCLVWAIGPIHRLGSVCFDKENGLYDQWLDGKPAKSVLYISFGSQATLSTSQMLELAKALEMSGKYFIWVVRPPLGFDKEADFDEENWFPSGFINRIKEAAKGLIIKNWAPQVEILSHKSVGAFLTHCGWNSVIEALTNGIPLLGWPMAADHFFISKFVDEKVGVCVEVARGVKCEVTHEDLSEKIESVMGESEKGKEIRRRACEVKEMIRNAIRDEDGIKGSSVKAMDEFLNAALSTNEKKEMAKEGKNV